MRFHLLIAAALMLPSIPALAQTPQVPPRNVADVLAVLDQYKPDSALTNERLAIANREPPSIALEEKDVGRRQAQSIFFHQRARAARELGRTRQSIDDLYKALEFVTTDAAVEQQSVGDSNRIVSELLKQEFSAGSLSKAIEHGKFLSTKSSRSYDIVGYAALAEIYALLGRIDDAKYAAREAEAAVRYARGWGLFRYFAKSWTAIIQKAKATVLEAEGNFGEAERLLRSSLENREAAYLELPAQQRASTGAPSKEIYLALWIETEARLSKNLQRQGRVVDAEYFARSGLIRSLQALGRYSITSATAISELGAVVLESGRPSEAVALANAAILSMELAGVAPDSLGLAMSRSLLGASHVAAGRWQDAQRVFELRNQSLSKDPTQHAAISGDDANWGVALLRTGAVNQSLLMLERIYKKRLSSGLREDEYFTAESRGFYAMALATAGQSEKALAEFQGTIPVLLDDARRNSGGEQGGAVARQMRLVWILESYMKLLVDLRDSPLLKAAGIDAAAETFRIADVARGSAVQRALAESAARATPSDPALADLARREQDAQQRFGTLSDLLNRLLSAPPEQQLPKIIADLRRDIEALRVERDKLKLELAQRFPGYAELIAPKPATLAQVQAALAPDEALISIYVGTERSYVWAVPKAGKAAFAEVALTDAELARQVAHLRKALDVGEVALNEMPRFDLAQSHDLYRKLLLPVEAGWREAKNLVIVPHKALGQLPFALLATAASPAAKIPATGAKGALFEEYRGVPWLLRRAAVTQLPSVSTLLALRRMPAAKPGRKEFIGFGDPLFSNAMALAANNGAITRKRFRNLGISTVAAAPLAIVPDAPVPVPAATVANSAGLAQLARLPDTAEEITSIARVLKADAANDIFLGRAASEKNVKSGQLDNRRIVMFATHGLVPGDLNGLTQPALALSAPEVTGNPNEDGLLTMEEVLGLRLNADWVVLSACNTAAGEGAGSEAVSGLGKAFFFAGARTLLVSNWPVETVSAKLLTTKLFEHQTANPGATRAEALRSTMLDLMDSSAPVELPGTPGYTYAHPMFWAPFSLVGDGGR